MGKGRSYSRMIGFGGADQMRVATHTSWAERMGNSCCGSVFGLILLCAGLGLIGWNEYRTVVTMQIIEAGESAVKEVACGTNGTAGAAPAPPMPDGELIHVSCAISNVPVLTDMPGVAPPGPPPPGGNVWVSERAIWLGKHVEYFAWKEHESCSEHKEQGGGTTKVCDYKYTQEWMAESAVKEPKNPKDAGQHSNHEVTKSLGSDSKIYGQGAHQPMVGPYQLGPPLASQLTAATTIAAPQCNGAVRSGKYCEQCKNPSTCHTSPTIGDARAWYEYGTTTYASLMGAQKTNATDGAKKLISWAPKGKSSSYSPFPKAMADKKTAA